jgi:antitoxin HigA-1
MYPLLTITENNLMPKSRMRPIHPGEILREEYLQPLNLTPNALAIALRVPAPRINDIVLERRAITPNTALRLARYFGGDAESWMNLQVAFDLKQAELAEGTQIRTEVKPRAA